MLFRRCNFPFLLFQIIDCEIFCNNLRLYYFTGAIIDLFGDVSKHSILHNINYSSKYIKLLTAYSFILVKTASFGIKSDPPLLLNCTTPSLTNKTAVAETPFFPFSVI